MLRRDDLWVDRAHEFRERGSVSRARSALVACQAKERSIPGIVFLGGPAHAVAASTG